MQMTEPVLTRLKQVAEIYEKAKQMILLAEEIDPSFRSNIMVIKELRDSNDHFMRLFSEWLSSGDSAPDEKYMIVQIDKARGHVFRAAYDAIDGIVVSSKIKLANATKKVSNGAITAVYPDYYTHAVEIDHVSEKVAGHRKDKDVADDSLQNLEAYAEEAKRVAGYCNAALVKVPLMVAWDKKNRVNVFVEKVVYAIIVGLVVGAFVKYGPQLRQGSKPSSETTFPSNNR